MCLRVCVCVDMCIFDEIKLQASLICFLCCQIFGDCMEMVREYQLVSSKNILVLLLMSAVLERALGNVNKMSHVSFYFNCHCIYLLAFLFFILLQTSKVTEKDD